jgi:hypothetical protein
MPPAGPLASQLQLHPAVTQSSTARYLVVPGLVARHARRLIHGLILINHRRFSMFFALSRSSLFCLLRASASDTSVGLRQPAAEVLCTHIDAHTAICGSTVLPKSKTRVMVFFNYFWIFDQVCAPPRASHFKLSITHPPIGCIYQI